MNQYIEAILIILLVSIVCMSVLGITALFHLPEITTAYDAFFGEVL